MSPTAVIDETPLPRLPARQADTHKGHFGTALLVGGAQGMAGAISLAGMAALRAGTGLVRLAVPAPSQPTVAGFSPCYMTLPLLADADGRLAAGADKAIAGHIATATAIGCGPGLGRSAASDALAAYWYQNVGQPMVIDADALNALASRPDALATPGGPRVLTPHPGEFLRLTARREKLSPDERRPLAEAFSRQTGAVVVLKGHRTIVTDGERTSVNPTGNPGMASGGMGDALVGVMVALLCQGLSPYDAARLGVYVHGLAGDLAAGEIGPVGIVATDLIDRLPRALAQAQQ